MVMICSHECPCCRKFAQTGDFWHCEDCWNRYHNGLRDKDWLDKDEWEKMHPDRPDIKQGIIDCEKTISDFKRRAYEQKGRENENRVRKAVGKKRRQIEGN